MMRLLAFAILTAIGTAGCPAPAPPADFENCGADAATLQLSLDDSISSTTIDGGVLVALAVSASVPCLQGVTHVTMVTSAGQFATGVPATGSSTGTGGTGGGGGSGGGSGAGSNNGNGPTQGISGASGTLVNLLLSDNGSGLLVAYATLQLGSLRSARIQATLGDVSACGLLVPSGDGEPIDSGSTMAAGDSDDASFDGTSPNAGEALDGTVVDATAANEGVIDADGGGASGVVYMLCSCVDGSVCSE